jgi:hypothetical protein
MLLIENESLISNIFRDFVLYLVHLIVSAGRYAQLIDIIMGQAYVKCLLMVLAGKRNLNKFC